MRRRADYLVTVIGTLIFIFLLGVIVGSCSTKAHGAAVDVSDEMVFADRSLIEGGAMPCVTLEKADSAAPAEEVEETVEQVHYYSVNGKMLAPDLQDCLRAQLASRSIPWMFECSLAQIFQESKFNCNAVNPNGLDMGLCQFRITYWDKFAREAGLVTHDIFNPYDQIYVYAYLMAKYINSTGDAYAALSMYYTGGSYYSAQYVNDVTKWFSTIRTVK